MRSLTGRYDNPIPTRFLAPEDCLKIPAQFKYYWLCFKQGFSLIASAVCTLYIVQLHMQRIRLWFTVEYAAEINRINHVHKYWMKYANMLADCIY